MIQMCDDQELRGQRAARSDSDQARTHRRRLATTGASERVRLTDLHVCGLAVSESAHSAPIIPSTLHTRSRPADTSMLCERLPRRGCGLYHC
jgi:hypothetical protein